MSERATPASIVRREDLRFDETVEPLPRPTTPEVDAILGRPIRVLDHGFVRLVDYMGGDGAIVQAARVSYGLGTRKASEDKALIRYLLRNRHSSPFEMVELKLHVKAPIFVARQWLRHRTACLAGDTVLAFDDFAGSDLPEREGEGAGGAGEEPSRGITIADFYRLWQEGKEERARHSRTLHPDRIDPGWRYSLPALARLVERDEEHLRGLVAGGRLVAEQDRDGLFVRGSAWQEYARRHAAALSPDREELARLPLRMCDEQTGEIRATRVVDIWQSGIRPVYRVTLANGKSLTMTKDHLCLTERGWLTLGRATGVRRHLDGTVTWNPDAPAFAVNGVARPPGAEEVAAPTEAGEQPTDAPGLPGLPGPLVRWLRERALPFVAGKWTAAPEQPQAARPRLYCAFSPVARIEYAGEEMTYDLEVAGPYHNFVANGFVVHNSVNELSARYSILPDELYLPDDTQISFQSTDNKQGRSAAEVDPAVRARVRELLLAGQRSAYATYQELLDAEIARELARIALPVAVYSEWYWKINLHNLFHFLELRTDPHAQFEIRLYGEAICLIAQRVAPVAYEAFDNYIRDAIRLSGVERELVTRALRGEDLGPDDWKRLGKRERAEFARKFGLDPDALVPRTAPVTSPDDAPANGHAPEKVIG